MTTEPSTRRPLSGLEWRLLLTTGLASTYLVAWFALQKTLPPSAPVPQAVAAVDVGVIDARSPAAPRRSRAVAAGVPRAAAPRPPRAATPTPAPVARSRPHRVRTRSS